MHGMLGRKVGVSLLRPTAPGGTPRWLTWSVVDKATAVPKSDSPRGYRRNSFILRRMDAPARQLVGRCAEIFCKNGLFGL